LIHLIQAHVVKIRYASFRRSDQPRLAQNPEMMRKGRFRHFRAWSRASAGQGFAASVEQPLEDLEAHRIAESAQYPTQGDVLLRGMYKAGHMLILIQSLASVLLFHTIEL